MSQPMPALLLTLLVGTTAAAQPAALARERVERRVTLPASPAEGAPEVHVARGVLTTLILDAPVDRASVELEKRASHFKLVEVAERAILLEPSVELGPGARLGLRMRLEDGTPVALGLTSHPTQVDGRVDLERPLSVEALRAEFAEARARIVALEAQRGAGGPIGLRRAGMLDANGVRSRHIEAQASAQDKAGLKVTEVVAYRATQWALVEAEVTNLPGQQPWRPVRARLIGPGGLEVKVVAVWMEKSPLAPGERGLLLVQTEAPSWDVGMELRLEILDSSGARSLSISRVAL